MTINRPMLNALKSRHRLWIVLLGLTVVAILVGGAVYAQEDAPGVDILFLVDQSGSMGGSPEHPTPNDRLGLRFEAPQDFVELLGEDRIQIRPNAVYRVALLDFGDYAVPRLDWTSIAPTSWEELQSQLNELTKENGGLHPGKYATSNLGNTNFLDAFQKAKALFDQLGPSDPQRKRVIILLTDGQPCVPPPPAPDGTPPPMPCQNPYQHMAELQTFVKTNFPSPQYQIFVVAMNDSESDYWKQMKPRWEQIAHGWARKVSSNHEVGIYFHDILREITQDIPKPPDGPDETVKHIVPGPIIVPPYLDTISFTLFKRTPDETLEVKDESGRLLTPDMPNVDVSGKNIYKLTVSSPEPGRWLVSTNAKSEEVDIEMRYVTARGNLLSPLGSQVQFVPIIISWQLLDSKGNPLPEYKDPRYRLRPEVVVISPEGNKTPLELAYKGESTYEASFTPLTPGTYAIEMNATSQDLEGNEIVVYQGKIADFVVSPVSLGPVDLPYQYPQFSLLTLTYELRDQAGNPVGVESGVSVSATIHTEDESWDIAFRNQPDGTIVAEFTPVKTGLYTIDIVANTTLPSGEVKTLTQGDGGSFSVVAPVFQLLEPVGAQPQHLPMTIRYRVENGLGEEWKLSPGYQLDFTATPTREGTSLPPILLAQEDAETFSGSFVPEEEGNYVIQTKAEVQTPDGTRISVFQDEFQVTVVPTELLHLALKRPKDGEKQFVRKLALNPKGFFSKPVPMVIEVQIEDEKGAPQAPDTVFEASSPVPLELSVINKETKQDVSDRFHLQPTGVPGLFRAEAEDIPRGVYRVTVRVPEEVTTKPAFVMLEAQRQNQANVQRAENPYWLLLWAVIIVVIVGLIIGFLVRRIRLKRLSVHPARGTLQIENVQGIPLTTLTLGGRNYLKYQKLSPMTHIKQLEVWCKTDADSKAGRVHIRAQLDDGSIAKGMLSPGGGKIQLGKYQLYIRKIN